MKNKIVVFLSLFVILQLSSCSNSSSSIEIDLMSSKLISTEKLSEIVNIKRITTLPRDSSVVFGNIQKVISHNNVLLISDNRAITVFSYEDSTMLQIRRLGRGPQEYLEITDFCVLNNQICILDARSRIITYSLTGEFLSKKALPYKCDAIANFNNQFILRCCDTSCDYRILISDSELDNEHYYINTTPQQTDCRRFFGVTAFYQSELGTIFHEPANNSIFLFSQGEAPVEYVLEFNRRNPFPAIWNRNPMETVMDLLSTLNNEGYSYGTPAFAGAPEHFICTYRNGQVKDLCLCRYNGLETNTYQNLAIDGEIYPVSELSCFFNSKDDLIFLISGREENDTSEKIIQASFVSHE